MFGNPNVSPSPVDDIYSSQANTYGNSFQNPVNPANMNPGWGIDPSLLSPSYSAGYRPQYNGPQGYNSYGRPGFFKSAMNLSPTSPDVPWGNPFMHQQSDIESVSNKPFDGGMWGAQHIVAPVIAYGLGRSIAAKTGLGWKAGSRFGAGMGGGIASGFGMNSTTGGIRATAAGIKAAYGAEGISGAFGAIKAVGFGGAGNLAARGVMGSALGVAAWGAVPIAISQGLMYGAEKGIFDPYINTRKSAEDLRNNFSGITFSGEGGNVSTGGGLGYRQSTSMAQQITQSGIADMTFSTGQYRQGADMVSRAGLLDGVDAKGITKGIKESMEQVKLIMSIARMPEMRDAIEELAKLQRAGASTVGGLNSSAAGAMRQLGGYASQAGTSVSRLLNTVGAQGQYLYQANGMTPYLGQMAAGNSYAAFAAGRRMGVIGTEQLARMGGLDGATQASLTGQINGSQTTFNQMALLMNGNKSGSAYGTSSATDVTSRFGAAMSNDPLGGYGSMLLYGRQLAGKQMEGRGSLAIQDQLLAIAKNIPGAIDKNGKISAEHAAPLLQNMGFDKDAMQAYFAQAAAESDPETLQVRLKALRKNTIEQESQYVSQNGIYGGAIGGSIYGLRKAGRWATKAVAKNVVDPVTDSVGQFGDAVQEATNWAWFSGTLRTDRKQEGDEYIGLKQAPKNNEQSPTFKLDRFNVKWGDTKYFSTAEQLNKLVTKGNPDAVKYFSSKDSNERSTILRKMIRNGDLGQEATSDIIGSDISSNISNLTGLDKYLDSLKTVNLDPTKVDKSWKNSLDDDLAYSTSSPTRSDSQRLSRIDLADKIVNKLATGDLSEISSSDELMKDKDVASYAKVIGTTDGLKVLKDTDLVYKRASSRSTLELANQYVSRKESNKWNSKELKAEYEKLEKSDPAKAEKIRIKDTADAMGGLHQGGLKNANDLETMEVQGAEQVSRNEMKMRQGMLDMVKEGRLDMTGYQNKTAAMDMGKAVDLFEKAVDKFAKANGKDEAEPSNRPDFILDLRRRIGWEPKNMGKASGNPDKK